VSDLDVTVIRKHCMSGTIWRSIRESFDSWIFLSRRRLIAILAPTLAAIECYRVTLRKPRRFHLLT
jgi:hypothetical protein